MIKALIIDDEPQLRELNHSLLQNNFDEIEVVGTGGSVKEGVELIKQHKPDLLILDIELTDGTGFNILQKVRPYNFAVIFVTAHNEFAIKAIKFSALDYILKPVNEHEFCAAVERAIAIVNSSEVEKQVETFFDYLDKKTQNRKIVLKTSEAINIVEIANIVFCQSDNSYTTFYLNNKEKILTSRSLKEYEELLCDYGFFRPHHSYLVNIQFISRLEKSDGGYLIMKDNTQIPLSTRRKAKLFQLLDKL